jgi:ligand-binding sensor domain-containing protein
VSKFDGKEFVNLTTDDGLLNDAVYNLWREQSGIWWFCTELRVSRYDPVAHREGRPPFRNYTAQDGLVAGPIHAVTQTPDRRMWFGSVSAGMGFSSFDGEKFFTVRPQEGFANVLKMTATPDGVVWLGTENGLVRFDGTNLVNVTRELGVTTYADTPSVAADGTIWFGGWFSGVWRYDPAAEKTDPKKLQALTPKDGLMGAVFHLPDRWKSLAHHFCRRVALRWHELRPLYRGG